MAIGGFLNPSNANALMSKFSGGGDMFQSGRIQRDPQTLPNVMQNPNQGSVFGDMSNSPGRMGDLYRNGKIQTLSGGGNNNGNMMTPQNQSQPSYQPNFQPNYTPNFNVMTPGPMQQQGQISPIGPSPNMIPGGITSTSGIAGGMGSPMQSPIQKSARLSNAFRTR